MRLQSWTDFYLQLAVVDAFRRSRCSYSDKAAGVVAIAAS